VRDEILVRTGKHILAIPKKYNPYSRDYSLCIKKDTRIEEAGNWIVFNWNNPLFHEIPGVKFILKKLKEDDVDLFEYTVRRLKK